MSSVESIPAGWELVKRYTWADQGHTKFTEDRDHPGRSYEELFVRRKVEEGSRKEGEEDLYLWKLVEDRVNVGRVVHIEDPDVVQSKAVAIVALMALYLVAKTMRDFGILITSMGVDLVHARFWCVIKDVGAFVWGKVRDPFFAVAVVACALFTIIKPFEGRSLVAAVERRWHHVDVLRDPEARIHYQECRHDTCELDLESIPILCSRNHYFLIAYCFQPHGWSEDPRYSVVPVKC